MTVLTPEQARELERMRQTARRSKAQGRRWYLRAILLVLIAMVAGYRGGQLNVTIGIVMVALSAMAVAMGRSMRRQASIMADRIDLMEHMSSEELGELSG